ncbi:hypothetical protein MMC27_008154 [Xylographa pallens]|nr:hypothetical protein [Xylographa pallens]
MLYRVLKIFDNLLLLCTCYVEHALPWAFVRLWGPKKASGAKTSAQSLISVADTLDTDIDLPSPVVQTSAIECTKSEAKARDIVGDDMTAKRVISIDSPESGSGAGVSHMRSLTTPIAVEYGKNKDYIQTDDSKVNASGYERNTAQGEMKIEGTSQPPEDEGYFSAEDNLECPESGPERLSVRQRQMQQVVRSTIFEPFDSVEHSEIARPPLLALLTASAVSLPIPTLLHQPSGGDRRLSSFPSLQTFDDIPGLRRESLSKAETMRLVTISAETTSRAHHHWLRPCSACARKAGAEPKGWHLLLKIKTGDNTKEDSSNEGGKEPGVYRRTAHWVKKQEERIKHL